MNDNAKAWVAALRSGEFPQGKKRLLRDGRYCCLGVACELYAKEHPEFPVDRSFMPSITRFGISISLLSPEVMNWLNLRTDNGEYQEGSLSRLNDSGHTFEEIATIIESEPRWLFRALSHETSLA